MGETKVDEGTLEARLRKDLKLDDDFPVFIPAATYRKDNKTITTHLIEGYAFVASGLPEVDYFVLERRAYVNQVMTTMSESGMRVLSTIPDQRVQELKHKLRVIVSEGITLGMQVEVIDGTYSKLIGEVVGLEDDYALVYFCLRSLKVIAKIPRVFLMEAGDAWTQST